MCEGRGGWGGVGWRGVAWVAWVGGVGGGGGGGGGGARHTHTIPLAQPVGPSEVMDESLVDDDGLTECEITSTPDSHRFRQNSNNRIDWFADELRLNLYPANPFINESIDCCM